MQHPQHAIIAAAGLGSRLGLDMPKCLVPIAGRRVIEYQLDLLTEVPDVRVVVGFKELEVIEHVRAIRPDVTFVRNPAYLTTSTTDSLLLATRDLEDPYLIIDGDLLIERKGFERFLAACNDGVDLIGVSPSGTDEAVFTDLDEHGDFVTGFQRETRRDYEWCGIAFLDKARLNHSSRYVYEVITPHLPLRAQKILTFEIDTPNDLRRAQENLANLL